MVIGVGNICCVGVTVGRDCGGTVAGCSRPTEVAGVSGSRKDAPVDDVKAKSLGRGAWLVKSMSERVGGIRACSRSVAKLGRPSRVEEYLRGRFLRRSRKLSKPVESGVSGDGEWLNLPESLESLRDSDGGLESGE